MKSIEELKDLLRDASREIDFYSDLYSDIDIDSIEDHDDFREKIPEVEKETLLEFYKDGSFELGSKDSDRAILARPTSGTTSDMACYYRTRGEMDAHIERFLRATDHFFDGGKDKDRVMVATTFSLTPIMSNQFMEKGCMVTSGSPFDLERTAEVFTTMECNTLVCSPPVALKISEKLRERGYEGLEKYYFVSSGMSSLTEARFREMYPDAEIMLQYGLAETGIVMQQCPHLKGENKYHLFEESPFHYEFITEEGKEADRGEIGRIVLTKFNDTTPLIRYSVGDLFERRGECECGKDIYKFISRDEDKFKIQGVTVFKDRIEEALEPVKHHMKHYQVVIDESVEDDLPKPQIKLRAELENSSDKVRQEIADAFATNFEVADEYNWRKGVEMDIFAPVKVKPKEFDGRKFRKIIDERYE